ncbi:septation protein SepH [Actinotalea sp. C106]|uniref:septation protein SepH n=1 Tax=Actinotalea sp. C106 TaxID=2908644 RepID=UPI0020288D88|nr:septation protein SepH [Actinotalea sp. C106]
MSELSLVGLHEGGEHVVLEGPDGQRFRLPIDEALRAAVRRDRPQLEQVRAEAAGALPPREIQARVRAGASAEEVAEDSGMRVEIVRRYTGPVLAEREYVAQQARSTRIGHDPGAPELGDLVTDRLATRGVDSASIGWDAHRHGSAPWTVEMRFEVGGAVRSARWTYEAATRTVRAVDDEARWLSETELADSPIPRRHLAAVRSSLEVDVDAALGPLLASIDPPVEVEPPEADPHEETAALLDDLTDRRGVRQQLDLDEEEDEAFEGFGPQHTFDFDNPEVFGRDLGPVPAAHPPHSRPDQATDARVLRLPPVLSPAAGQGEEPPTPEALDPEEAPTAAPRSDAEEAEPTEVPERTTTAPRARSRRGRASVPSWDEIVFGAKPE